LPITVTALRSADLELRIINLKRNKMKNNSKNRKLILIRIKNSVRKNLEPIIDKPLSAEIKKEAFAMIYNILRTETEVLKKHYKKWKQYTPNFNKIKVFKTFLENSQNTVL
jgi:hypothetical protein